MVVVMDFDVTQLFTNMPSTILSYRLHCPRCLYRLPQISAWITLQQLRLARLLEQLTEGPNANNFHCILALQLEYDYA
jgi:hypothetical protein